MPFEIAQEDPQVVTTIKPSQYIRVGYAMVGGKQHMGCYCPEEDDPTQPSAVCILGAFHLGRDGHALGSSEDNIEAQDAFCEAFAKAHGAWPQDMNDNGVAWQVIVAKAEAIGL